MKGEAPQPYSLEQARREILALNDERIAQLNRILAAEAMIKTIISELPLEMVQQILERYDLRKVHAMANVEPGVYRPHLWEHYTEKLQELSDLRQRNRPPASP